MASSILTSVSRDIKPILKERIPPASPLQLLGIQIDNLTMKEALHTLETRIAQRKKTRVFYVNPDCLNKIVKDRNYLNLLEKAEQVYPDGVGLKIAAKMTKQVLRENINGTDMFPHLCQRANSKGYRLFFLGAKPGVAQKMADNLKQRYPHLKIVGVQDGYFSEEQTQNIIHNINQAQPDMLFVAMGAPRQEAWISQYFNALDVPLMFGVGGLFDFYSGNIPRAPLWMRKTGLEWTWRLLQEPGRMWRRYILGNPLFLWRIFRYGQQQISI